MSVVTGLLRIEAEYRYPLSLPLSTSHIFALPSLAPSVCRSPFSALSLDLNSIICSDPPSPFTNQRKVPVPYVPYSALSALPMPRFLPY